MNYLKPGAFGVFLVPSSLFQTKESQSFVKWIQSVAYLQGLINLPAELLLIRMRKNQFCYCSARRR